MAYTIKIHIKLTQILWTHGRIKKKTCVVSKVKNEKISVKITSIRNNY